MTTRDEVQRLADAYALTDPNGFTRKALEWGIAQFDLREQDASILTQIKRLATPEDVRPPENVCLLTNKHYAHEWWYTSEDGGHMLSRYELGAKRHYCPGNK